MQLLLGQPQAVGLRVELGVERNDTSIGFLQFTLEFAIRATQRAVAFADGFRIRLISHSGSLGLFGRVLIRLRQPAMRVRLERHRQAD